MINAINIRKTTAVGLLLCTILVGWALWASQTRVVHDTNTQTLEQSFTSEAAQTRQHFEPFDAALRPGDAPPPLAKDEAQRRRDKAQKAAKAKRLAPKLPPPEQTAVRSKASGKALTYKPATLIVVTNFQKAQITVNGRPYPVSTEPDDRTGMVLPAGGPHTVSVTYDGKTRVYDLSLRPYERRFLVVELSGYKAVAAAAAPPTTQAPVPAVEAKKEEESTGRVTIYSKPRGIILMDGKDTGKKAPNTVIAELGRHEMQVRYEDGEISEKKIVRVRKSSRIKLFFRQRKK